MEIKNTISLRKLLFMIDQKLLRTGKILKVFRGLGQGSINIYRNEDKI